MLLFEGGKIRMAYQGNLLSKTLVIGIIILFIGMSVVSSTGNISKESFIYKSNNPPYEPSNPYPPGDLPVPIDVNLSWYGGDFDPEDTVTYDVYFGEFDPFGFPPFNGSVGPYPANQTRIWYDIPGVLEFDTKYYWRIRAYDNHGASNMSSIWTFTTEPNYPPVPKICCASVGLDFREVGPGQNVTGQIKVCNCGDELSFLNWHVDTASVPTWGTWEFIPENGTELLAPNCAIIDVKCTVREEDEYSYIIYVYNTDNLSDYCEVSTSVPPPYKATTYSLFQLFFNRFPLLEVIILRAMNLLR